MTSLQGWKLVLSSNSIKALKKQARMYYRLRTGICCCTGTGQILCGHSPGGSTLLCEITRWAPKLPKIRLCQSMHTYLFWSELKQRSF